MASPAVAQSNKRVALSPQAALRQELLRRQEAREHLIPFCQYVWPGFQPRLHRRLIAGALEMVERGEITRLMIFTPPQVGKSTLVSQFFPTWYLGRNPDNDMILCSYNADLAMRHSRRARQNMREQGYRAIFGDLSGIQKHVALSQDVASAKDWQIASPHRGGLHAAGVGGGISGFGAKLILVDDPLKGAKEADSDITRSDHINWYKEEALARLSHGEDGEGAVIICQTRWHDNDLSGYLLKAQADGGELYHVLRLPAMAEDKVTIAEWCKANFVTKDRFLVAEMMDLEAAA